MASTLTSNLPGNIIPPTDDDAVGYPLRIDPITITSTVPLTGNVIYFDFGFTDSPGRVDTGIPVGGWSINYQNAGSYFASLRNAPDANLNGHHRILVTGSGANSFLIGLTYIPGRDYGGFLPVTNTLGEVVNLNITDALTRSSYSSTNDFETAAASVYNEERTFYFRIVHKQSDGTLNELTITKSTRLAFWNRDENGNLYTDISSFLVTIESGGLQTPAIRTGANNIIKWRLDTSLSVPVLYQAGIFKAGEPDSGGDIITNLGLQMSNPPAGPALPNHVPDDAFVSLTNPVNTSGTIWEAQAVVDGTKLEQGKSYYFYISFLDGGSGKRRSVISNLIPSTNTASPAYGNTAFSMFTYDRQSKIWATDRLLNVAPLERVRIIVSMDKSSYNASAVATGAGGTFDLNFSDVLFYTDVNLPQTTAEVLTKGVSVPAASITDDPAFLQASRTVRIPRSFAFKDSYAIFAFVFDMPLGYRDIIVRPFALNVRDFDDGPNGDGVLTLVSLKDQDGDDIPVNSICLGSVETVTALFTLGVGAPEDYSFIPYFRAQNSDAIGEHDAYLNNNIEQLTSPLVISTDIDFTGGDAEVVFDASLIPANTVFCVGAIAKLGASIAPPDPPPVSGCATFDVDIVQTIDEVTPNQFRLTTVVAISNISDGGSGERILINIASGDPSINIFGVVASFQQNSATFSGVIVDFNGTTPNRPRQFNINYSGSIDLRPPGAPNENICSYNIAFSMYAYVNTGEITVESLNLSITP